MVILGDEGWTYNGPPAVLMVTEGQTGQRVRSSLAARVRPPLTAADDFHPGEKFQASIAA
jgi:hypothetical protein